MSPEVVQQFSNMGFSALVAGVLLFFVLNSITKKLDKAIEAIDALQKSQDKTNTLLERILDRQAGASRLVLPGEEGKAA